MEILSWREGTSTVIQPDGDLDLAATPRLREVLDEVLATHRPPRLVIDLTKVPFCDSAGLGLLINTLTRVRDANGRLVLAVTPGMITNLLTITNLDKHFEIHETTQAAQLSLAKAA
ncbi:anti-sigma factor antagonist [Microtetraspora sp. NBRC 13810]|nr:anti-sigma factor antagonist [Microtetraspora sp. NBRC 13810]